MSSSSSTTKENIYVEIGEAITMARKRKGWSQEQLSKELLPEVKLQRTSIANIELGKQRMMLHDLVHIAKVLDLKLKLTFTQPTEAQP